MKDRSVRRRSGFTLIEVMLVAGILALLAAFVVPRLFSQAEKAKIDLAKAAVLRNGSIGKGLEAYKWDMGRYPDTDEGLAALYQPKSKRSDESRYDGPYMEGSFEQLKDPWANAYSYRCPGEVNEDSYDVWSWGPDGKDDGGKEGSDDIKNWVEK
ncbi:MAG: type II secretion system major pseudopilin GspG [Planctomycetes bacterium]|nr:type II secretion system major pseudopilin GspG [Planctomycetota bacterium]